MLVDWKQASDKWEASWLIWSELGEGLMDMYLGEFGLLRKHMQKGADKFGLEPGHGEFVLQ